MAVRHEATREVREGPSEPEGNGENEPQPVASAETSLLDSPQNKRKGIMKTAGNRFIKDLRLFCLIGVIALALITIVSTGGCGGGGDSGDSGGGGDNGEPTTMPGQATYINFRVLTRAGY